MISFQESRLRHLHFFNGDIYTLWLDIERKGLSFKLWAFTFEVWINSLFFASAADDAHNILHSAQWSELHEYSK